jgi:hypothetical protein
MERRQDGRPLCTEYALGLALVSFAEFFYPAPELGGLQWFFTVTTKRTQ